MGVRVEALVAIGTIGLAGLTASLAWTTRAVARTTRDELIGQWRPVLLALNADVTPVIPPADMDADHYGTEVSRVNPADAERGRCTHDSNPTVSARRCRGSCCWMVYRDVAHRRAPAGRERKPVLAVAFRCVLRRCCFVL